VEYDLEGEGAFLAPIQERRKEERVSERVKVRGGVGKGFEGAVDELDFNIPVCSDPDVRPRKNRLRYERCYLVLVGGQVVTTGM
jgi:hypothetical protein